MIDATLITQKILNEIMEIFAFENHYSNRNYWIFIAQLNDFRKKDPYRWEVMTNTTVFKTLDKKYDFQHSIELFELF
jgi:hypothetical protein